MQNKLNQFNIFNPEIENDDVFVIAEIGKNFIKTEEDKSVEEYLKNAKELIKKAHESGANAVKFQTHNPEDEQLNIDITSPHFVGSDRYKWVARNYWATPLEFWQELKKYCDELGIIFFSTPMSRGAAKKLEQVGVDLWKVGSGDILDFACLDFMAETKKPIIFSSGMSTLEEIDKAVNFLKKRNANMSLLHCVSKYPCPPEELNLNTIEFFKKRYEMPIGFSDHSIGYESAIAAVNLGAKIIEKHFSLSRELWGADHKVSMTPEEFKIMTEKIRNKEKINLYNYGRESKILNDGEAVFRPIFRKSLMAGANIKSGTILEKEMIYAMRPQKYAGGLPSEEYENVIGKKVKQDLKKYDPINWDVIHDGKKRKVCFVITSKIHYSRSKKILSELNKRDDIELQIVIGASAVLYKYGDILNLLKEDGFECNAKIIMTLEGGSPAAMAKTAGIGITEFTTAFDNLDPDVVVVRGDRYEVLSAAIAAAYLNITVAHIEGGDVTGTIDESVRHAITKLAHIHFATNEKSKQRIIRMGENPEYVFDFGCPELEILKDNTYKISNEEINKEGVGDYIDIEKPFLMVMQHSVTSEMEKNEKNIIETIKAIKNINIPTVWFWPNVDAGTDEVAGAIRRYRERYDFNKNTRFIIYLPPEKFLALLKKSSCLIGNSSSGIKECSFLGTPVINIGTRQDGRMRAENIVDVDYNSEKIEKAILRQLGHGKYMQSNIYYQDDTAKKIVDILAKINLYTQKRFCD
ncbi:MAG: UDP-N-acetylglucosamine 2-epimerase [Candidatus Falkowbacteria bacterium]